jgi:predicted MFS family arabinose efflux permease
VSGWPALFAGSAALLAAAAALAGRTLPAAEAATAAEVTSRPFREIRAHPGLLPFAAAALLASFNFVALGTVLPIVAISDYALSEWQWGLLAGVNPLMVVLAQMWLTRRAGRYAARPKLVAGTLLMGLPFLLLVLDHRTVTIVAVIVISVTGEMIWTPTAQALASRLPPAHLRSSYLGLHSGVISAAYALGPLLALNVLDAAGPPLVWLLFAVMTAIAAVVGYRSTTG